MRWYERKPGQLQAEAREVRERFPDLQVLIQRKGYEILPGYSLPRDEVVVEGACPLGPNSQVAGPSYEIAIVLPQRYPQEVPSLYCKDPSLTRDIERHILPNGWGCLCVRSEYRRFMSSDYRLAEFISRLVVPFLVGQYSYEVNGVWPWRDRSHGADGIVEAWKELVGFGDEKVVLAFLEALSRRGGYAGHLPCPCGSSEKLRGCHSALYRKLRECVNWEDAQSDLQTVRASPNTCIT